MMLTTHALVGAALAIPVAFVAPEFASVALVAGFIGGAFPDIDVLARHRRTLHFPRYYAVPALVASVAALLVPSVATVGAALFFAAAWLHSISDVAGGGPGIRPWEQTTERGVYDHAAGRWLRARRWVRYDGAPEDLALVVVLAVPVAYVAAGPVLYAVVTAVAISVMYTVFRRRIVPFAERVETVSFVDEDDTDKTL